MKSDRRIRYTKKVIKESFMDLLLNRPSHKITVKEVCEKAEINRTTFYSYYDDIHSLTKEMQNDSISDIRQYLLQYSVDGDDMILYFVKILQNSFPYASKYILYDNNSKYFIRLFYECKDLILSNWLKGHVKITPIQQEWLYTFLASGCAGILRTWFMGGMKESAEEIASFLNQLIKCHDVIFDAK
ncbi:MAG: transcriptional regulator, TetR family [Herbinix sp.]|nr:transcriptional regulator, TetR family [Herbinix sp.]